MRLLSPTTSNFFIVKMFATNPQLFEPFWSAAESAFAFLICQRKKGLDDRRMVGASFYKTDRFHWGTRGRRDYRFHSLEDDGPNGFDPVSQRK